MAEPLIKTRNDVYDVLADMRKSMAIATMVDVETGIIIMKCVCRAMLQVPIHRATEIDSTLFESTFLDLGSVAIGTVEAEANERKIDVDFDAFVDLLLSKHQAYGAEPIIETGINGLGSRMLAKICRFENVRKQKLQGAPVEDTLIDILGYCILGVKYSHRLGLAVDAAQTLFDREVK
jgi:hypothetical protein